jgi:hypothetical protein
MLCTRLGNYQGALKDSQQCVKVRGPFIRRRLKHWEADPSSA